MARFDHVERCDSVDGRSAVEAFWEKAMDSRSEGLMIKVCRPYLLNILRAISKIHPHSY